MAIRTFRDPSGIEWQVWEVHPSLAERRAREDRRAGQRETSDRRKLEQARADLPDDLRRGWLAFRSVVERSRRTPIPPGWESLSDDELGELVQRAERLGPPRRLIE